MTELDESSRFSDLCALTTKTSSQDSGDQQSLVLVTRFWKTARIFSIDKETCPLPTLPC